MAAGGEEDIVVDDTPDTAVARRRNPATKILRWVGYILLALVAAILLFIAFLHTPPGRQLIVDQISKVAPASGLKARCALRP